MLVLEAMAVSPFCAKNTSKKVLRTAVTEEVAAVSSSKQSAVKHPSTSSPAKATSRPDGARMGKERVKEVNEGRTMSLLYPWGRSCAKYGAKIRLKTKQNGYV